MKIIDLYYQREGSRDIGHLEIASDATLDSLKALFIQKHGITSDAVYFFEDDDDPIGQAFSLKDRAAGKGLKLHIHRCRQIAVTISFNGTAADRRFVPSATVARVKRWAAEKFGMSPEEAGEHVLQIAGTHDRPAPGTHIGSLTSGRTCAVAFDLVPDERINGSYGGAA